MASSTALSCVGGVLACSLAVFALPASHTGVWVCNGKLSWDPDLYFYSRCEKQFKFKDAKRSVWAISWNGVRLGVFLFGFLFVFFAILILEPLLTDFCFSKKSHVTTDVNCAFLVAMWLFEKDVRIKKWEGEKRWILISSLSSYPNLHLAKESCFLERIFSWKSENIVWKGENHRVKWCLIHI